MNNKIGEIIREIRNEKGMSLRRLAEIVNVSNVNILYIEKGKINTSLPVLKGIANALNYNIDKLKIYYYNASEIYPGCGKIKKKEDDRTYKVEMLLKEKYELKIGDRIAFTTDAGTDLTRIVESILTDTVLQISTAVGGSNVTTKAPTTRQRTKIQGAENNVAISV